MQTLIEWDFFLPFPKLFFILLSLDLYIYDMEYFINNRDISIKFILVFKFR